MNSGVASRLRNHAVLLGFLRLGTIHVYTGLCGASYKRNYAGYWRLATPLAMRETDVVVETNVRITVTVPGLPVAEQALEAWINSKYIIHCPCCGQKTTVKNGVTACEACEREIVFEFSVAAGESK